MNPEAIILAGGLGTRLRSVVADRPKVLASVGGRPFILRLLDQLAGAAVPLAVISTGHMADQVETVVGPVHGAMPVRFSRETSPMGTGGAIRLALDATASNPLLVMNGDSFCAFDLGQFLAFHRAKHSRASILLALVPDTSRFGQVQLAPDSSVVRFEEKGKGGSPGWINAGIYLLNRELFTAIPRERAISIEREIFPSLIGSGLHGLQAGGAFLDIGTPASYAEAEDFFRKPLFHSGPEAL